MHSIVDVGSSAPDVEVLARPFIFSGGIAQSSPAPSILRQTLEVPGAYIRTCVCVECVCECVITTFTLGGKAPRAYAETAVSQLSVCSITRFNLHLHSIAHKREHFKLKLYRALKPVRFAKLCKIGQNTTAAKT